MRSILVAGMMLAASAAGAQDFGVTKDQFWQALKRFEPTELSAGACKPDRGLEMCLFSDRPDKTRVIAGSKASGVVAEVMIIAPTATWASQASLLTQAQRALMIPPDRMIDSRELTKTASTLSGVPLSARTSAITCSVAAFPENGNTMAICKPK